MKTDLANAHNRCEMSIRWKLFKNKTTPTPGLFCSCHGVFLDWLKDNVAYDLINNHKVPVEEWIERKKKTDPTVLSWKEKRDSIRARIAKRKQTKKAKAKYKLTTGRDMPR